MANKVLILDATYRPLGFTSWKKAIALHWLDKADILEEYEEILRSPSFEMRVPAVIRLTQFTRRKEPRIKFSKRNLYTRDNGCCVYCKRPVTYETSTLDHVKPRAQGGTTCWENIVICCHKCNEWKDNRTPSEAGMPIVAPRMPTHWELIRQTALLMEDIPEQWKFYLESHVK